jgi:hypothetical protein
VTEHRQQAPDAEIGPRKPTDDPASRTWEQTPKMREAASFMPNTNWLWIG